MSETETTEKNNAPATATGADDRAARVRHRFVGALCILAVAVLLWELGDDVPPPNFSDTQTPATQFPNKDFVQIQTQPPHSQIQTIPTPAPPTHPTPPTRPTQSTPPTHPAPSHPSPSSAQSNQSSSAQSNQSASDTQPASDIQPAPDGTVPNDDASAYGADPDGNNTASDIASLNSSANGADSLASEAASQSPSENLVQVGAFQQAEGAEQLARWLRGDGFEVVVRKDDDGLHRVFSSADPEHLAALGYISENESPSSPSSSESESPSSSSSPSSSESKTESDSDSESASSPFVVQLGAFSNEKRAREMAAELRAQQFAARIEPVRRGGETLFRVRVVGLADRDSAEAMRRRLAEMGHAAAQTMDTR